MTFGGFLGFKSITIVEVDELNGKKMKSLKISHHYFVLDWC